jgi:hypothetical protein
MVSIRRALKVRPTSRRRLVERHALVGTHPGRVLRGQLAAEPVVGQHLPDVVVAGQQYGLVPAGHAHPRHRTFLAQPRPVGGGLQRGGVWKRIHGSFVVDSAQLDLPDVVTALDGPRNLNIVKAE